ncbi:tetratricopeptide repeat protein [Duganella violaceipulchra]|uniref:Tetratricopeptide (TPR) repeat protein n=1 Tax=Duganella violaceipulchra TaxID=2849652 RepID=A0AA41H6M6_9BURK|nr:tetratricopeptide repeat protein [Duganella violaceicalia]MBV6322953.1 tetratricopeptide repeat protein [Duganella violaceicalia]MCP2008034.1 tetratricopeptide (TPR) repeat protein [Duganella violaceicalia]
MKNAFAIVTLSALLSACAVAPQKEPESAAAAPADAAAESPAPLAAAPAPAEEALPNVELTSDMLFRITKAELEFKQGQWQGAYITLLALAQQTRDPRLARRAAEMALTAKQGPEALSAIRLWRGLAPDSDEATQYFLGFAVVNDDLGEAEQIFVERLKAAPVQARPLAMFQMQQFLLRAKDKSAAYALEERVLAPYSGTLESHLILAQGAFALGDNERSRAEAEQALRIKPDSELAILTMAQVSGDIDTALKVLSTFLDKYPKSREVRAAYARILADAKQTEPARKEFLTLLKDQPDNLATLYALGVMAMQSNDMPNAEKYFTDFIKVLADHPSDERDPSKVLMILSQIAEQRNDFDAAYNWLDKVDGSDEKIYLAARMKMAQLTARKGNVDEARKQLAELKPTEAVDQAQIFQADAQILRDAGDNRAAYVVLENAVKRYPDNPDLLYDFALIAEKMGQVELMEKALRQVMIAAPDNQHAYNALGYSLAERNERLPEAYSLIDKAMKMAPGDPFIMDSMGWVQYRMGNLSEAEALLRRAYALRGDPEIAVHLGEVLFVKGDKTGAQQMWQEAQTKDPKNDALKSTLARLKLSL